MVKGFQHKEGVDYTKIFSLVVKITTIGTVHGLVAQENMHLQHMNVKWPFSLWLGGKIYIHQPHGFDVKINDKNGVFISKEFVWFETWA